MKPEASDSLRFLDGVQESGTLVVVFANSEYKAVLDIWLSALQPLGVRNYVVVALDQPLLEEMRKRRTNVLYRPCPANLKSLWIHRTNVLLELLEAGFHIVHSDADAIWRRNPLDSYIYGKDHDLIFSPGTYWPLDVHNKWQFVLCCGFFYARSNVRTREFFADLAQAVRLEHDDQICVNRILMERGLVWDAQESYEMAIRGHTVRYYVEAAAGRAGELKVCVLPHAQFQRLPAAEDDIHIQHWLSDKSALSKLEVIGTET